MATPKFESSIIFRPPSLSGIFSWFRTLKTGSPWRGRYALMLDRDPYTAPLGLKNKKKRMIWTQRFNLWICCWDVGCRDGGFGWDVLGTWVQNNPQIISQQPVSISVTYIINLHLIAERFSNLVTRVRQYAFIVNLFENGISVHSSVCSIFVIVHEDSWLMQNFRNITKSWKNCTSAY